MPNGTLAIYDPDIDYVHNLSEYLRSRDDFLYDIIIFTDTEALKKYSKQIDILLFSDLSLCTDYINATDIFFLCDENSLPPDRDFKALYKYQPADQILRQIMEQSRFCSANAPISMGIHKSARIIGIYSPISRCGKTSFSISLGLSLCKSASTILISFDTFSYLRDFAPKNSRDISDLLFYYGEDLEHFSDRLVSMSYDIRELHFICPPLMPDKIKSTEIDKWESLLKAIIDCGVYQNVIIDISNSFPAPEKIMDLCTTVYMPVLKDFISTIKLRQYEDYLDNVHKHRLYSIKKLSLPLPEEYSSKEEYLENILRSYCLYDDSINK